MLKIAQEQQNKLAEIYKNVKIPSSVTEILSEVVKPNTTETALLPKLKRTRDQLFIVGMLYVALLCALMLLSGLLSGLSSVSMLVKALLNVVSNLTLNLGYYVMVPGGVILIAKPLVEHAVRLEQERRQGMNAKVEVTDVTEVTNITTNTPEIDANPTLTPIILPTLEHIPEETEENVLTSPPSSPRKAVRLAN